MCGSNVVAVPRFVSPCLSSSGNMYTRLCLRYSLIMTVSFPVSALLAMFDAFSTHSFEKCLDDANHPME